MRILLKKNPQKKAYVYGYHVQIHAENRNSNANASLTYSPRSNTNTFPHFYNPALSQPYALASTIASTIFKNLSRYSVAVVVMLISPLPFPL